MHGYSLGFKVFRAQGVYIIRSLGFRVYGVFRGFIGLRGNPWLRLHVW